MSETVSAGREAGQQAEALAAGVARGSRRRGGWVAAGLVVVLAAGGAAGAWRAGQRASSVMPKCGLQAAAACSRASAIASRVDAHCWMSG